MSNGSSTQTCPACQGEGAVGSLTTGRTITCPVCNGQGAVSQENTFPAPFHYVFGGTAGSFAVPSGGQVGFPKQLANEWEWELIFMMGRADFPDGIALLLEDVGSQFKFSDYPVAFANFCGNAQLPFPEGLEPYRFGKKTNLTITAYDIGTILQPALVIGTGDGVTKTFAGVLARNGQSQGGPVLPGSVGVTDPPGVIVGSDSAKNGAIATVPPGVGIIGTINYQTGAISVTYAAAPAVGDLITVAWTSGVALNNVEIDMWGHALLTAVGTGAIAPALGS
ncbi:MAG: hypothetical protein ABSH01_25050 [Terriglobia bacterium]